jgi:hypothetical protein
MIFDRAMTVLVFYFIFKDVAIGDVGLLVLFRWD